MPDRDTREYAGTVATYWVYTVSVVEAHMGQPRLRTYSRSLAHRTAEFWRQYGATVEVLRRREVPPDEWEVDDGEDSRTVLMPDIDSVL